MAKAVVIGSLISVGLAGALCALAVQAAGGSSFVVPGSKAAGLENCVKPTDFMRRNHMEEIKHQRDETVHNGIRATDLSLAGCIECHVSYGSDSAPIAVDDDDQFCGACHQYLAVGLDCFGCHAAVPNPSRAAENSALTGVKADLAWHRPGSGAALAGYGMQPAEGGEGN